MANSHKDKLKVIYFIQEYTKIQQDKGIPNTRILKNINVIYPFCMTTFYNYMGINAKVRLRQLGADMAELEKQKDYILSIIPSSSYTFNNKTAGKLSQKLAKVSQAVIEVSKQLQLFNN